MITTVSSKGQVVVPRLLRARLNLTPGTKLECEIQGESLVLTPSPRQPRGTGHVIDPISGLRISRPPKGTPPVTSETVKALLVDFP